MSDGLFRPIPVQGPVMETVLKPCRVPWAISPSTSGLTLTHAETDVEPQCTVVLGGGRLQDDGRTDDRRIEIAFRECYFARTGPLPDTVGVEVLGYRVIEEHQVPADQYIDWRRREWRATGVCPNSSFYIATQSEWLAGIPKIYREGSNHYVVEGRDSYVELIARGFQWREWKWLGGHREGAPSTGEVVGEGEAVE